MDRNQIGCFGEGMAAEYLSMAGYQIVEKNFRCKLGEIDLIGRKENTLVFCEVKTRSGDMYGRPCEAVNNRKKDHIRKVALYYMNTHDCGNSDFRFDVMEIYLSYIKGAF